MSCPTRTCQCLSVPGRPSDEGSVCGYTDGPYVYTCDKGCCSEDCKATRGNLVKERLREKTGKSWTERLGEIRVQLFGTAMPPGVIALVVILVIVVVIAAISMLKEKKPFQRRNGR